MDFYNHKKQQIERILYLAERESTGNLRELSSHLEVSERTVKRIVQYLRDEGIPIVFCRKTNSYIISVAEEFTPSSKNKSALKELSCLRMILN